MDSNRLHAIVDRIQGAALREFEREANDDAGRWASDALETADLAPFRAATANLLRKLDTLRQQVMALPENRE